MNEHALQLLKKDAVAWRSKKDTHCAVGCKKPTEKPSVWLLKMQGR